MHLNHIGSFPIKSSGLRVPRGSSVVRQEAPISPHGTLRVVGLYVSIVIRPLPQAKHAPEND